MYPVKHTPSHHRCDIKLDKKKKKNHVDQCFCQMRFMDGEVAVVPPNKIYYWFSHTLSTVYTVHYITQTVNYSFAVALYSSCCCCRSRECQGRFHPSCDPEGLAVPEDRWMFVLESLLCLIGIGGKEEIRGHLNASTLLSFFSTTPAPSKFTIIPCDIRLGDQRRNKGFKIWWNRFK